MRSLPVCLLCLGLAVAAGTGSARAQPADCAPDPNAPTTAGVPLALNLGELPGTPAGVRGQVYVVAPFGAGGMACTDRAPPPRDILRGETGDGRYGEEGDLLRGAVR